MRLQWSSSRSASPSPPCPSLQYMAPASGKTRRGTAALSLRPHERLSPPTTSSARHANRPPMRYGPRSARFATPRAACASTHACLRSARLCSTSTPACAWPSPLTALCPRPPMPAPARAVPAPTCLPAYPPVRSTALAAGRGRLPAPVRAYLPVRLPACPLYPLWPQAAGATVVGVAVFLGFAFQTASLKFISPAKCAFLTGVSIPLIAVLACILGCRMPSKVPPTSRSRLGKSGVSICCAYMSFDVVLISVSSAQVQGMGATSFSHHTIHLSSDIPFDIPFDVCGCDTRLLRLRCPPDAAPVPG